MERLVPFTSEENAWVKQELPGSRSQRFLHNLLVSRIDEARQKLETAPAAEVLGLQVAIKEARVLLGELHAYDNESVKRIYALEPSSR